VIISYVSVTFRTNHHQGSPSAAGGSCGGSSFFGSSGGKLGYITDLIYLFLLLTVLDFLENRLGFGREVRVLAGLESVTNIYACPLFVMVNSAVSLPNCALQPNETVVNLIGLFANGSIVSGVAHHGDIPTIFVQDYIAQLITFVAG